jgi:hypothetical protein
MPAFTPVVPPCAPQVLTLMADAGNGDFDGMSHAGTWLVVTNRSGQACTVPGLPTAVFKDGNGVILRAARKGPVGMHPGPVVVPVRLEPGASARTSVRWVAGDVFDKGRCVDAARVELRFGNQVVATGMTAHLCAEQGQPVSFEQSPLMRAER